MPFESWDALYHSRVQWPFAVMLLPAAFLVYRAAGRPAPGRAIAAGGDAWMQRWSICFAILTIADPLCTGPLATAVGGGATGLGLSFAFVWLGDFRIFTLLFGTAASARGERTGAALGSAALYACIVPAIAGALYLALGRPDMKWLWLSYELSFLAMALWLARVWLPRQSLDLPTHEYLRGMTGFAAVYYALWAGADLVILAGFDEGWALRMVPNQLYYAVTVPLAYFRFYSRPLAVA